MCAFFDVWQVHWEKQICGSWFYIYNNILDSVIEHIIRPHWKKRVFHIFNFLLCFPYDCLHFTSVDHPYCIKTKEHFPIAASLSKLFLKFIALCEPGRSMTFFLFFFITYLYTHIENGLRMRLIQLYAYWGCCVVYTVILHICSGSAHDMFTYSSCLLKSANIGQVTAKRSQGKQKDANN